MPAPYPQEFRDDVVAVARGRDSKTTLRQIADDFGIAEATLTNWLEAADVADGSRPGVSLDQAAELRELKRRNRLLEQENEVLRRAAAYLSQANLKLGGGSSNDLPARERAGRRRDPRHGRVPGSEACASAVLPLARGSGHVR